MKPRREYCAQYKLKDESEWTNCSYSVSSDLVRVISIMQQNMKDYPQYNWRVATREVSDWEA